MLIYRSLTLLILRTSLTLVTVLGQISLNRLQNGEVIVNRHPEDPSPLYRLPTLIVPGSIEYQTTVDGVVIKFTTSMELTRTSGKTTSVTSTAGNSRSTPSHNPPHDHRIRPTRVHEGVIEVFSDSNLIVAFDDPDSLIPLSSLPVIPSSIPLPAPSSSPSSISPSSSSAGPATLSSSGLMTFPHAATPVLPPLDAAVASSPPSVSDHPYASFFPLPFEESPFEALRSKADSSVASISPTSPLSSGSPARVWKTLTSPRNPWRRLFSQQIHASAGATSSITGTGHESTTLPSSRDSQRVRMNRLKLKVKNTEKLYDICLKDVCLRGQLPQAVLLIGSQMLSPSATATSPAPHHTSDPQSLDVKSEGHESREAVYDAKGSKDETEEEDKSGVKSMPNYDFPLPNDWREAQDLQTVENQRIRNQIKLNVDVPSFIETNLTSITPSLSLSSSWTPGSGVRAAGARMKSGSHSGPGVAFLSFPSSPPSPHRPASSRVSVSVAGSWGGSGSVSSSSPAATLPLLSPSMTQVSTIVETVAGDSMTGEGDEVMPARTTSSHRPLYPLLSIVSSSPSPSIPMDELRGSGGDATPNLPYTAVPLTGPSSHAQLLSQGLVTLSHTFSRPMASTSRVTIWKHHRAHQQPVNFTITESFFINQVITAFRTMPSAIMTHAILNPGWQDDNKMIITPSSTSSSIMAVTGSQYGRQIPFSLPAYVPMIDPSTYAFIVSDDLYDHPHRHHHTQSHQPHPHAHAESRQITVNLRRNPILSRLRSSRGPQAGLPVVPTPVLVVKTQLRSQVETKILAIIYNADSTKFKTITHTKYFSTRITMTRTTTVTEMIPFTRSRRSG